MRQNSTPKGRVGKIVGNANRFALAPLVGSTRRPHAHNSAGSITTDLRDIMCESRPAPKSRRHLAAAGRLISLEVNARTREARKGEPDGGIVASYPRRRIERMPKRYDSVMGDLGLRPLARNPGFALLVAGILAIGIGANSVIFSLFDTILLRPLPVRDPDALVRIVQHLPKSEPIVVSRTPTMRPCATMPAP